jgi:hypothetical protein
LRPELARYEKVFGLSLSAEAAGGARARFDSLAAGMSGQVLA